MEVFINRVFENDKQTIGMLSVIDNNNLIFACYTLELPYKGNMRNISCINKGVYDVVKYNPKVGRNVFLFKDVSGRSMIEIHSGSYHQNTKGCILVGQGLRDLNSDNYIDLYNSVKTLDMLNHILPNEFKITVL